MPDTPSNQAEQSTAGASCAVSNGGLGTSMSRPARRSRMFAGVVFLAIAGALSQRRLPGAIALWPTALVPTWFGISHLIAGVIGYQGCPELGAIPTVMLGRPVGTSCGLWRRIDSWVDDSSGSASTSCC